MAEAPITRSRGTRRLALATAVVFSVSLVFPITAALARDVSPFPPWWGPADVGVAFVLAIMAVAVIAVGGRRGTQDAEQATYRTYRVLIHGVLGLVIVIFLAGNRITWSYGLLGLAWRAWLLLYGLPAWFTLLQAPPGPLPGSPTT